MHMYMYNAHTIYLMINLLIQCIHVLLLDDEELEEVSVPDPTSLGTPADLGGGFGNCY